MLLKTRAISWQIQSKERRCSYNLRSSNLHHHIYHHVIHEGAEGNEEKPGDCGVLQLVTPFNVANAVACARR
jgi:hypothetical protein